MPVVAIAPIAEAAEAVAMAETVAIPRPLAAVAVVAMVETAAMASPVAAGAADSVAMEALDNMAAAAEVDSLLTAETAATLNVPGIRAISLAEAEAAAGTGIPEAAEAMEPALLSTRKWAHLYELQDFP